MIRFRIVPPVDRPGDGVVVTGNLPALGGWEPARGLCLRWEPPFHVGEVEAETGMHLEFKITRGSWETEAVDAHGNVPANEVHDVWMDHTIQMTVADWKDRYAGRLTRDQIRSRVLAGTRDLRIWLPPSYAGDSFRRYPVWIFHDGDNVFDPRTSAVSGVDLAADEWAALLAREGVVPEAIVAGVCHPEGFTEENDSARDFDLSPELGGAAYAQFVATELVAHLDGHYRTLARPEARLLGGASLGALNTVYTAIRHPGVFTRFVCLSTSFHDVSGMPPAHCRHLHALANEPALPSGVRMYFDYGSVGLDECFEPYHRDLGALFREKGWVDGREFEIRRVFGGRHDELSWRERLGDAVKFLAGR